MSPVAGLALATASFVATHLLMSHPLRPGLVARLGEKSFSAVYSLVSLLTFGTVVWIARSFDGGAPLWVAPRWVWTLTGVLMLPVAILLVGSFAKNPAFPHPGAAEMLATREARGAFAVTRHPMNMAIAVWALLHIATLGSPRNLIIAGGMVILALVGSWGQDRRKAALYGETWRGWAERTGFVPFGAILAGRVRPAAAWPGWIALIGGLALWAGASWLHPQPVGPFALG